MIHSICLFLLTLAIFVVHPGFSLALRLIFRVKHFKMAVPGSLQELADVTASEETALAFLRQHNVIRRAAPGR